MSASSRRIRSGSFSRGLEAITGLLAPTSSGGPVVTSVYPALRDPEVAWRAFACGLLADALGEDDVQRARVVLLQDVGHRGLEVALRFGLEFQVMWFETELGILALEPGGDLGHAPGITPSIHGPRAA